MPAAASTFNLSPIRIQLSRGHRIGVVTLRNDGGDPVTVQVQACTWTQSEGTDLYQATSDLIATPPVFSVAPHGRQIVRVALREYQQAARERAYRLFFEEVPQPRSASSTGLRIYLRIGVPLFVAASPARGAALAWQARRVGAGELEILATNGGVEHVEVTTFDLQADALSAPLHVGAARYVLPGSTVSWRIRLPKALAGHPALHIHGITDRGAVLANATYSAS